MYELTGSKFRYIDYYVCLCLTCFWFWRRNSSILFEKETTTVQQSDMNALLGFIKFIMGFSREKLYALTPCWGYRFFGVDQSILPWPSWKSILFRKIFSYPSLWNSNDLCSTPLEFPIDILNRGITEFFFRKIPISWIWIVL